MSAFSDVLPKQAARVPPLRIEVIKGRRLKNQKTRRLSSLETVKFVKEETNKLSNILVIQRSSSPVGSPIVLAKKPSTEPGKNNYRMCADYKDDNANTKPRGCSIPNIRDSLHILIG
jgi:hypothetical protein